MPNPPIPFRALAFPFCTLFVIYFVIQLLEVPIVALIESAICERYYRSSLVADSGFEILSAEHCKVKPIQDKLAYITGFRTSFDASPGLFAVLFGIFADKYGSRILICMGMTGFLMSYIVIVLICGFSKTLPVELVWLSSACLYFGGGIQVFYYTVTSLVADIADVSHHTMCLYFLVTIAHTNRLVDQFIASALMKKDLSLPFWTTLIVLGVCTPIAWATVLYGKMTPVSKQNLEIQEETEPLLDNEQRTGGGSPVSQDSVSSRNTGDSIVTTLPKSFYQGIAETATLFRSKPMIFCLVAFTLKKLAFTSEDFMFQYASDTFDWELRKTTALREAQASGAITANLILGPAMSFLLIKMGFAREKLGVNAIRGSLAIATISFFASFRAASGEALVVAMVGCGLAEGVEPALQALVTSLTNSDHNTRLFTTIAVFDTVAKLISGPLMSTLMRVGHRIGPPWTGLFFLVSSILFGILTLWSFFLKARD